MQRVDQRCYGCFFKFMNVEAIPMSSSLPWGTRGAPPVPPPVAPPAPQAPPPQIFSTAPTSPTPALEAAEDVAANVSPNALPKVSLAITPARAAETYRSTSLSGMAQQLRVIAAPLEFGGLSASLEARQILSEADALDRLQIVGKSPALAEQESILQYDINNAFQAESTGGPVISNIDPELSTALGRLLSGVKGVLGVA